MSPIPHGWQTRAACRDADPELFFDHAADRSGTRAAAAAAAERRTDPYCGRCPVRITCLEYALDLGRETYGVWAGLGMAKRRHLAQARTRQRAEGHDPHRFTPGCSCSFCRIAAAHLARQVIDQNTAAARCGYRSTYGRNCRCSACTLAKLLDKRRSRVIAA